MKKRAPRKTLVAQNTLVNSQKLHFQVIGQEVQELKTQKDEIFQKY